MKQFEHIVGQENKQVGYFQGLKSRECDQSVTNNLQTSCKQQTNKMQPIDIFSIPCDKQAPYELVCITNSYPYVPKLLSLGLQTALLT